MLDAVGWNSWNSQCLNALSFIRDSRTEIEVRYTFLDEPRRERTTEIRWKHIVRLGPHAPDGSYGQIEVDAGFEARFRIEWAAEGETLAITVVPTRTSPVRTVLELTTPGLAARFERDGDTASLAGWVIDATGAEPAGRVLVRAAGPAIVGRPGEALAATVRRAGVLREAASAIVERGAARHARQSVRTDGALGGAPEVMASVAAWNTVCEPGGKGVCTTASRDWSRDWGGVVLFGWDTFLNGLIAGVESPAHAWANYSAALAGATTAGFVPNWSISNGLTTLDRSQPPVGSWCVWQTHLRSPDRDRLASLYPGLLRWHRWWNEARRDPDGLFAWGSDSTAHYSYPELTQRMYGAQICACYESGMDNSPMFDSVPYDPVSGRMLQADVGLTSMVAMDAQRLAQIANELGDDATARELRDEHRAICERIEELLWCEPAGLYLNRLPDGSYSRRCSPTSFYPLICGAAAPERARRMVDAHLLSPERFWGEYPLPSISRDDPDYMDNDYWRGRIWAPMVYLVSEGLRRYAMRDEARELVMRSLRMFRRNWQEQRSVYENYNAQSGDGGDVPNADRLYVWGGLIPYAALQGLVDVTDEGLVIGDWFGEAAGVASIGIAGRQVDVRVGPSGLHVSLDGCAWIRASRPIRVVASPEAVTLECPIGVRWAVAAGACVGAVRLVVNGVEREVRANGDGWVSEEE